MPGRALRWLTSLMPARDAYAANCATCHGADLSGGQFAGTLKGPAFLATWGDLPAGELLNYISTSMPPGGGGRLDRATYAALTALVLAENGVDTSVTLAAAQVPALAEDAEAGNEIGLPGITSRYPFPASPPLPDLFADYTPVTADMLDNPAPENWIAWRRGHDGARLLPARTNHARERRRPVHRLGAGPAPGPHHVRTAGARRGDVRPCLWRGGVRLRCRHRQAAVALSPPDARGHSDAGQEDYRAVGRQAHPGDQRSAHDGAGRADGSPGVGCCHPRCTGYAQQRRTTGGRRRGDDRPRHAASRRRADCGIRCRYGRAPVEFRHRRQDWHAGRRYLERGSRCGAAGRLCLDQRQL